MGGGDRRGEEGRRTGGDRSAGEGERTGPWSLRGRAARSAALLLAALCTAPACSDPLAQGPPLELGDADVRVLFVGNSLTYTNDLPGMVRALAEADGRSLAHATLALPDFSLEDHWNAGLAPLIRQAAADVVVLQQGPSSLPENQVHLRDWAGRIAPVVREAGGRPALLMVWPSRDREAFFPDVRAAYRNAAEAVDGLFFPAGATWLEAWARRPDLALWGGDGFHPARAGSLAAAMTVYAVLFDVPGADIPDLGLVDGDTLAVLREAVTASVGGSGGQGRGGPSGSR